MIKIGSYNRLTVDRRSDFGLYLTDGTDSVLLPRKFVPEGLEPGDVLRVFVSTDSEDRPVATTQKPKGVVGEFVALKATAVMGMGAFMDWGLDKDLLVPASEQHRRLEEGRFYGVAIRLDEETQRVYGSTKLSKFLTGDPSRLEIGQEVDLFVADLAQDGIRVVIDGLYFGTIFADEIFERLRVGDIRRGYIKRVREDGGIAVSLSPQGQKGVDSTGQIILDRLKRSGGFLPLGDNSPPEEIRREFGISKGVFKKAIGGLMKAGKLEITFHGIRLLDDKL